ncbi:MAG: flagellar basal body rod protein FlgB [Phycisphaerales bacterium]
MTLIDHVTNAGALPSLEATIRFSARRQALLAHNIANISTPNFQRKDVSPASFQASLREAVEARRERTGGHTGELPLRETREIGFDARGALRLTPRGGGNRVGVLAHDRNNRDLEQMMQDLAENLGVYRAATELMRSRLGTLRAAITERV